MSRAETAPAALLPGAQPNALAPSPALATLPVSVFVVGMAACALPAAGAAGG